jgi:hypothetical protein
LFNVLAAFWFASPWMLLGMGAIVVPIAVHLIARRSRREIVFSTNRLLAECVASSSVLFRLRRLVLLVLRCLLVLFLVAAFAQPGCSSREHVVKADEQVSLLVMMDVSASMGRAARHDSLRDASGVGDSIADDGVEGQIVELLKRNAEQSFDQLKQGVDQANIILVGASPRSVFPVLSQGRALSPNLSSLRREITDISITNEDADWHAAFHLASSMLHGVNGSKQIVVLSDMQRSNWSSLLRGFGKEFSDGTQIHIVSLRESASHKDDGKRSELLGRSDFTGSGTTLANVSLLAAQAVPARPLAGRPVQLVVEAKNHGSQRMEVLVNAVVNGQLLGQRAVQVDPRMATGVTFNHVFEKAGLNRIVFEIASSDAGQSKSTTAITDDAFAGSGGGVFGFDDRCYLAVRTQSRVPVVVVGDDDPQVAGSGSFFLHKALMPHGNDRDSFAVRQITSMQLSDPAYVWNEDDAHAVLVSAVDSLSAEALKRLAAYVNAGGGVTIFCGNGDVATNLRTFDEAIQYEVGGAERPGDEVRGVEDGAQILPWWVSGQRMVASFDTPFHFGNGGSWKHPVLSAFNSQGQNALKQIAFRRVWSTYNRLDQNRSVLTFDDGTPAIDEVDVGRGRIVLANFSASLTCSDLGKYGSFVALTHSLVDRLLPQRDWNVGVEVGRSFDTQVPVAKGDPVGRIVVLNANDQPVASELSREVGGVLARVAKVKQPGFLSVQRSSVKLFDVAANMNPDESDTQIVDTTKLADILKKKNATVYINRIQGRGMFGKSQVASDVFDVRGQMVWHWFVVAAGFAMCLELLAVSFWKQ